MLEFSLDFSVGASIAVEECARVDLLLILGARAAYKWRDIMNLLINNHKVKESVARIPCIEVMFLQVGALAYRVTSFAQASQMFCVARDKYGEGTSNTPTPLIVDGDGLVIARVSYNGRVWPGTAWTIDAKPLYDNQN